MKKENVLLSKSFDFALDILDFYKELKKNQHYDLASQVVRSGTSIGANIREAQRAVSKKDFINKLGIALKEADETEFWLQILDKKIAEVDENLFKKIDELIRLLVSIINSSKKIINTEIRNRSFKYQSKKILNSTF